MAGSTPRTVDTALSCYLYNPSSRMNQVEPRFLHRQKIIEAWDIPQGCRVLDIGCGQGESSLLLAVRGGDSAQITGIDNAPADYGGPYTVGQAQAHILDSALGSRIKFERADTAQWLLARSNRILSPPPSPLQLESPSETSHLPENGEHGIPNKSTTSEFDAAVFCHSLWYFPSTDAVTEIFRALATANIPRIYVAEWSGKANCLEQEPHRLAAEAQARLYALRPEDAPARLDEQNVRAALLPEELVRVASKEGWRLDRQGSLPTPSKMRDGYWEVQYIGSDRFLRAVEALDIGSKEKDELLCYRAKVSSAVDAVKKASRNLESMDITWIVLDRM